MPTEADEANDEAVPDAFCDAVAGRLVVAFDGPLSEASHGVLISWSDAEPTHLKGQVKRLGGDLVTNGDFRFGTDEWALTGAIAG